MPQKHYDWKLGEDLPKIGAHSLAKHRIIRRYVERYIEIVTATSWQEELNITFVAGYAGGGRYIAGRDTVPGSPLIFLEAVAAAAARLSATRPKGFRINADYVFVDQNPSHTEFLRAEIQSSRFAGELDRSIRVWTADFNERVEEVIAIARSRSPRVGRAVFLLDQYGWSQVAFRSVRAILQQLSKAEVFLTFSVDALIDYISDRSSEMRAFGEIDVDQAVVRELLQLKQDEQAGYRTLIQNGLYRHIQAVTDAPYYSPFFIKSTEAHRSYWLLHLSRHREARNEIGMIHWAENNTTIHHGRPGLHALGFTPGGDIEQLAMGYLFDGHARQLSRDVLKQQLPRLIYDAADSDIAPSLEDLFGLRCNDTPVVREILEETLIALRGEGELRIVDEEGRPKPRANRVDWSDRILLPPQRSFFGPFSQFSKAGK